MSELRFTRDHEWLRLDGDAITVGITDHAQQALGDLVFVELPEVGRVVAAGEACAVVESVKAASDVYAPLAGKIIETNQAIIDNPGLVNSAAQSDGWFFRIEPEDAAAAAAMMDEPAYAAFLETLA
jgi:glycine cleavage system H protein